MWRNRKKDTSKSFLILKREVVKKDDGYGAERMVSALYASLRKLNDKQYKEAKEMLITGILDGDVSNAEDIKNAQKEYAKSIAMKNPIPYDYSIRQERLVRQGDLCEKRLKSF